MNTKSLKKTNYKNTFNVRTNLFGDVFDGFDSCLVYLKVEFEDVSGQSAIIMRKIANQQILDYGMDDVEALLSLNGVYKTNYDVNEVLSNGNAEQIDSIIACFQGTQV